MNDTHYSNFPVSGQHWRVGNLSTLQTLSPETKVQKAVAIGGPFVIPILVGGAIDSQKIELMSSMPAGILFAMLSIGSTYLAMDAWKHVKEQQTMQADNSASWRTRYLAREAHRLVKVAAMGTLAAGILPIFLTSQLFRDRKSKIAKTITEKLDSIDDRIVDKMERIEAGIAQKRLEKDHLLGPEFSAKASFEILEELNSISDDDFQKIFQSNRLFNKGEPVHQIIHFWKTAEFPATLQLQDIKTQVLSESFATQFQTQLDRLSRLTDQESDYLPAVMQIREALSLSVQIATEVQEITGVTQNAMDTKASTVITAPTRKRL